MRIVFPLWGAWIGFVFGATLVASFADEGFLSSLLGWLVGLVFAVVFALLAYLFYEVAVIIGMATIGYVLGVAVLVALDVEWSWLVTLVGIACGALLAIAAVKLELPVVLLIVLTAAAGATAIVGGLMLVVGAIDIDDLVALRRDQRDRRLGLVVGARPRARHRRHRQPGTRRRVGYACRCARPGRRAEERRPRRSACPTRPSRTSSSEG